MSSKDDQFVKNFSIIVGGLAIFALLLMVFAGIFHDLLTVEVSAARIQAVEDRIQPIGAVYAGESGAQALAVAVAETPAPGGGEPLSGQEVYQTVCSACHGTGAGGAPTLDMAHWTERIAKGKKTLISHALHGFQGEAGIMPAKGGATYLTEEEVTKAVEFMLAQVKGG